MTIKELQYIRKVLERVTPQDQHIAKALAFVDKNLAVFAACKGQLKEQYDYDYSDVAGWGQ